MAKNEAGEKWAENPAARLHVARAGRGPSADVLAYGIGGVPATDQAARSEFDALSYPREGGEGYEATVPGDRPLPAGKPGNPVSPVRGPCPPGANRGSDYRSPGQGYRVRRARKSG